MEELTEVMVDLETLSTESDAVIVSIGVVPFSFEKYDTWESLTGVYLPLNINDQIKKGAHICGNTINWWMGQSAEARSVFTHDRPRNVRYALKVVEDFLKVYNAQNIWGNGSTFDNVILRNAFKRYDIEFPIPFWGDRDLRTLKALAGDIEEPKFPEDEIAHNALSDAKFQVLKAQAYYRSLKDEQRSRSPV